MATRVSFRQYVRAAAGVIALRPFVTTGIFAGSALSGAGLLIGVPGLIGGTPATAAPTAAYAPDVGSILDERSPGSRRYGWLLDTKYSRVIDPVERILSSVRRRPVVPDVPGDTLSVGAPIIPLALLPDTGVPADIVPTLGDPAFFASGGTPGGGPVGGGILPGGGGSGGGGSGDSANPDTPVTPPVSPVPEFGTWAMLVMGFMLVGALMRQRGAKLAIPR